MRKLRIMVVALMMTLLMAAPAHAAIVINQFGTVNINSNNTTENNEDNDTTLDAGAILAF